VEVRDRTAEDAAQATMDFERLGFQVFGSGPHGTGIGERDCTFQGGAMTA
jgi:hypothetical protein